MKNIPFAKPIIGEPEQAAVAETLEGPILVHGPRAKQFEKDFADFTRAPHALSVASCTAGLHLAYFYLGIGPGDEVIVPAQTHVATAHAVEYCGAKPVFVDADRETGNIEINAVARAISPRTKAISVVHFLGLAVDMDPIMKLANEHELFVVEDCALAMGTYYKGIHAGLIGDLGSFSFYPVKHMTTAEGGMIITRHSAVADRIQRQKAFGVDRTAGERTIPGVYDVTMLGFNYRMNEIEAALGIEQLKRVPDFLEQRKQNFSALYQYLEGIKGIQLLSPGNEKCGHSYYCLSIILDSAVRDKRLEIIQSINERGVGTSVYYPKPVPHMKYYKERYNISDNDFPNAARISYGSIALPVGPHLEQGDTERIASIVEDALLKAS